MVCKVNLESLQLLSIFYFWYRWEILPVSRKTVVTRSSSFLFLLCALVGSQLRKKRREEVGVSVIFGRLIVQGSYKEYDWLKIM